MNGHDETEICLIQNDDYDPHTDAREDLLGVTAYPTFAGDGLTDIWPTNCLEPTYAQRAPIPSPMTIDITEQGEGQFTAHLYAEEAITNAMFFMVATLSENVPSASGTSYLRNHVKVYMTSPLTGDALNMTAGESLDIVKSFTVEAGWDYELMGVAAWVSQPGGTDQSPCSYGPMGDTNEVLQSRWVACSADLTSVEESSPAARVSLSVVPNPFNPRTNIKYELSQPASVSLQVFDLAGRLVDTIARGEMQEAGSHTVVWNGRDHQGNELPSGVYLCRVKAGLLEETRRMVLIR